MVALTADGVKRTGTFQVERFNMLLTLHSPTSRADSRGRGRGVRAEELELFESQEQRIAAPILPHYCQQSIVGNVRTR